jgi:hypothetical protein
VSQKLLLKPGMRALVVNAPQAYLDLLPEDITVERDGKGPFDFVHLFATKRQELQSEGPSLRAAMKPNGLLWVSYPKGKAIPTDLNRDIVAKTLNEVGLQAVTQVAIDETWSALRAKIL